MAIQWSTAVRNARLDAIETAIGTAAKLMLYSGAMPANCAAALSGNTLLVEYDLGSDWMSNAAGGVKALAGLPIVVAGIGAGNASFYRFYATDGVTCHEQGTISATGGGGDMILDNVNIAVGQNVQIVSFSKTEPGA